MLTVRPGADVDFLGALCVGWRRIAVCTQQRGKLCVLWVGGVAMPASTPPLPRLLRPYCVAGSVLLP